MFFSVVEINNFDMTEIKLVSEKCFQLSPFLPYFFLLAKKYQKKRQKKPVPKGRFETPDSGKNCSIQEMSATSIMGIIQAM